ncbi:hypothetical protein K9M48_01525 [Candidatus Gracilibacteria bacterium]|nr:hypothetical protein [Candidatus Gracilibacteria bacterium]
MNKKLITIGTVGAILIFSANLSSGQEIAKVLNQKKPQTEQINKELKDTLNFQNTNKEKYQEQKNKMLKNGDKELFKKLIEVYLSSIEEKIIQNPEGRRRELELLYFDCEFIDIKTPEKLKYLLGLSNSRVIN